MLRGGTEIFVTDASSTFGCRIWNHIHTS